MINGLRERLENQRNPQIAEEMSKYLKNQFILFGIKAQPRYEIFKKHLEETGFPKLQEISSIMREAFLQPERDFHYFGIYLYEKSSKALVKEHVEDIQYMILTNSWWDTVDYAINKTLSPLVKRNLDLIETHLIPWNKAQNIWLNRASILFQLKWKTETDFELLKKMITNHKSSKEFFVQKAMGWALREYSKTSELKVRKFIDEKSLPKLTEREALKWINNPNKR